MNVATPKEAFFRLKNAQSYRFWKRLGQNMLDVSKDQILKATTKEDIDYFRARPDVIIECNAEGIPLSSLGGEQGDTGKSKTYRVYGRAATPTQPVAPAPETTTRVEANPQAIVEKPPIPPDPFANVPLPTSNASILKEAPPPEFSEAPPPPSADPYVGMSDDEKMTLQKQRIAAGMAPDPTLPLPSTGSPMIAALEAAMTANPEQADTLRPLLEKAKAEELVKLQSLASAGGVTPNPATVAVDPHRRPEARRGSLLAEIQMEQQNDALNSPVEFANPDGTTDKLSGR